MCQQSLSKRDNRVHVTDIEARTSAFLRHKRELSWIDNTTTPLPTNARTLLRTWLPSLQMGTRFVGKNNFYFIFQETASIRLSNTTHQQTHRSRHVHHLTEESKHHPEARVTLNRLCFYRHASDSTMEFCYPRQFVEEESLVFNPAIPLIWCRTLRL
jgi:hypothetical protein